MKKDLRFYVELMFIILLASMMTMSFTFWYAGNLKKVRTSPGVQNAQNDKAQDVPESENIKTISPCEKHSDCPLPMIFALQSNCPFDALCIESECKVVCPLPHPDGLTCRADSDCDCSERGEKTAECLCIDGKCVSVEMR